MNSLPNLVYIPPMNSSISKTADAYTALITDRLTWPQYSTCTFTDVSPYGYDAAWALALILNRSSEVLKTKIFADGSKRRLEDFTYEDSEMANLLLDILNETDFNGMTVYDCSNIVNLCYSGHYVIMILGNNLKCIMTLNVISVYNML